MGLFKRLWDSRKKGMLKYEYDPDQPTTCIVIEKATGRTVTQATARGYGKWKAEAMARLMVLDKLKRKIKRRYDFLSEFELVYRYSGEGGDK